MDPYPAPPPPTRRRPAPAVVAVAAVALVVAAAAVVWYGEASARAQASRTGSVADAPGLLAQTNGADAAAQLGARPLAQGMLGRPFGRRFGGVGGTVTAVSASSLTVRRADGSTTTVALTSSTAYYVDVRRASRADVKVGARVAIQVTDPRASSLTAGAVYVVLPSLAGTVTDVQASSFTVTDRAGFRHVVHTTGSTAYTKDGQSASRSAVVKGARVLAVGSIDANGTDLTASRVEVRTRAAGRNCGPGGPSSSTTPSSPSSSGTTA